MFIIITPKNGSIEINHTKYVHSPDCHSSAAELPRGGAVSELGRPILLIDSALRVLIPRLDPDRIGNCDPRPAGSGAGAAGGGVCIGGRGGRGGILVEGGRARDDA